MTAKTIDEYIADSDPDVRERLNRLRETIHSVVPGAAENIRYGMPAIQIAASRPNTGWLHFAAWKRHIGIYPVHKQAAELEARLKPYRSGTDTLKFPLTEPTPYELVRAIVEAEGLDD